MRRRSPAPWSLIALLLVLLVGGCASAPEPEPPPPLARISVELLSGFAPEALDPVGESPVVVLVDVTRSMLEPAAGGKTLAVAARRGAARFVDGLGAGQPVWIYAIGAAQNEPGCQPPLRLGRANLPSEREPLLDQLRGLESFGEGGLPAALVALGDEMRVHGALPGARVVLFSDLAGDCGGDLCTSAERLVEAGARLDVTVIGTAPVPACLEEARQAVSAPPGTLGARGVSFRLERSGPEPVELGRSLTGGPPVAVPHGRGTVVVDLDPPLRVEAYFAPGRDHVLQVLEFPALDPPTRRWRWKESSRRAEESTP